MKALTIVMMVLLLGSTVFAVVATLAQWGADDIEHPEGISLRQESVQKTPKGFFGYYGVARSHSGGGLQGGK